MGGPKGPPCGRGTVRSFLYSLSSEQPLCSLRKGVIHKRVETLVSTLLCPCRAGKIRSLRKRQTFVYNDLTNPRFDFRTHAKNKTPPCRCSPISNLHDSCRWVLCLIPLRFQLPCIPGRPAAQYQNFPKSRTKNVG